MGLNESYSQARNQIMMISPTPSVNRAYAMVVDQESQRTLVNLTQAVHISDSSDGTTSALFCNSKVSNQGINGSSKGKKPQVVCEVCGFKGHTRETCYRIVGYPPNRKGKKKGVISQYNTGHVDNSRSYVNHVDVFTRRTRTSDHTYGYWPQ